MGVDGVASSEAISGNGRVKAQRQAGTWHVPGKPVWPEQMMERVRPERKLRTESSRAPRWGLHILP